MLKYSPPGQTSLVCKLDQIDDEHFFKIEYKIKDKTCHLKLHL